MAKTDGLEKVKLALQRRMKKLRLQREGCRGGGMCETDFARMREIRYEMKGVEYALGVIGRAK
jgi:hypothetical protein